MGSPQQNDTTQGQKQKDTKQEPISTEAAIAQAEQALQARKEAHLAEYHDSIHSREAAEVQAVKDIAEWRSRLQQASDRGDLDGVQQAHKKIEALYALRTTVLSELRRIRDVGMNPHDPETLRLANAVQSARGIDAQIPHRQYEAALRDFRAALGPLVAAAQRVQDAAKPVLATTPQIIDLIADL
jgi:hypothetical protein